MASSSKTGLNPPAGRQVRRTLAALLLAASSPDAPAAEAPPLVRSNYGNVGLIDTPTARMAPDGELSVGATFFENSQRYDLGFQVLPWLEGSFRYSGLQHFEAGYPVYYDRSFAVKARLWNESGILPAVAIGINDLIGTGVYSSEYIVASKSLGRFDASIGMGWGRLSQANNFRNPIAALSRSFETRPGLTGAGGTNFNAYFHGPNVGIFGGIAWHTPIDRLTVMAEFSSDKYAMESASGNFIPRNQWNLGLSYQATDGVALGLNWLYGRSIGGNISFQLDPRSDPFPEKLGPPPLEVVVRSPEEQKLALQTMLQTRNRDAAPLIAATRIRTAAKNAFVDALWREEELSDVQIQGRALLLRPVNPVATCTIAARLAQTYDSEIDMVMIQRKSAATSRCAVSRVNSISAMATPDSPSSSLIQIIAPHDIMIINAASPHDNAVETIRRDTAAQNLVIEALSLNETEAAVYYSNNHYFSETDALDRLIRILMADAPPSVEKFRLTAVQGGVPQQTFSILRAPQERNFEQGGSRWLLDKSVTIIPPPLENPVLSVAMDTYPRFSWSVFPQFRQSLFDPNEPFAVQLLLGASASLELFRGLSLNAGVETSLFDNFREDRVSDSKLPHVRSDFLQYFAQGKSGIGNLDATYRFRLAPDVFAVARAGYLESMFAGAGGEVLWRPEGQRWALGADLYQVWQRDFDRLFGLQDYRAVTGHISIYYTSPWYGLNFAVRTGQYLAGDRGFTVEVTRRFSTGVEIGAFVTRTNVSGAQFGEGSFDKGIMIRIPVGWLAPIETQSQLGFDLRPVQRDGGQRLVGDALLYNETRRASLGEIYLHNSDY